MLIYCINCIEDHILKEYDNEDIRLTRTKSTLLHTARLCDYRYEGKADFELRAHSMRRYKGKQSKLSSRMYIRHRISLRAFGQRQKHFVERGSANTIDLKLYFILSRRQKHLPP